MDQEDDHSSIWILCIIIYPLSLLFSKEAAPNIANHSLNISSNDTAL